MICSSCGHENPADSNFCLECGQPLGVCCPKCGAELPPAAKFCNRCGQRSAEPRADVPSPEPALFSPSSFASGRYQVQRFLGEGAKKRVYLARDERLNREVAFSLIKTESVGDIRFGEGREAALKGISENQGLFPVEWR